MVNTTWQDFEGDDNIKDTDFDFTGDKDRGPRIGIEMYLICEPVNQEKYLHD